MSQYVTVNLYHENRQIYETGEQKEVVRRLGKQTIKEDGTIYQSRAYFSKESRAIATIFRTSASRIDARPVAAPFSAIGVSLFPLRVNKMQE